MGVDVFFVMSGFVITGLLLRERANSGATRLLAFYGRRSRRILPAATLVIMVTVLASYHWLGFITGDETGVTGRTAALFYCKFPFHLDRHELSRIPSSTFTPAELLVALGRRAVLRRLSDSFHRRRGRLVKGQPPAEADRIAVDRSVIASFTWSVVETSTNGVVAYFSPFTRAWELALGGLVAVASLQLAKLPRTVALAMTWVGLAGILVAGFAYSSSTPYPGSAVALPVIATALVVAGGTAAPKWGSEWILHIPPFQWLGKLSYSLYLWHWPILIIAAQYAGHSLSVTDNLLWLLLALAISIASYFGYREPHQSLETPGPLRRQERLHGSHPHRCVAWPYYI